MLRSVVDPGAEHKRAAVANKAAGPKKEALLLRDIARVVDQFDDRRFWWVLGKAVVATVVLLVLMVAALAVLVDVLVATGIAWLDPVLPWLTGAGGLVAALFLMPVATMSVLGLFVDEVAAAVEDRYYPDLAAAAPAGPLAQLGQALRLLAATVALNLVALPLYLLLPGANVVIFLSLNGYLLGREYFEAVALRRLRPREVTAVRRRHRGRVFGAGVAAAGLALVPLANLLVPVAGTALMVHRCASLPEIAGAGRTERRKV